MNEKDKSYVFYILVSGNTIINSCYQKKGNINERLVFLQTE